MSYLNTENIIVFPSTRRSKTQISSRLISEQSFSSQINKLIDTQGFIITKDDELSNKNFEFNVFGYYFSVSGTDNESGFSKVTSLFPNATNIYAAIEIERSSSVDNYYELIGQDNVENSVSVYKGVEFVTSPKTSTSSHEYHNLLVATKSGSTWTVPATSRARFESELNNIIDGGTI